MAERRKSQPTQYVTHPRFGNKPRFTHDSYSLQEIVQSYWDYRENEVILGTCIEADIQKQKFAVFPRTLYVDLKRTCQTCGSSFIFYAKEQQYWYEHLGFYIDCDCTKCSQCRKKDQKLKRLKKRYDDLININRTPNEDIEFKKAAYKLGQLGYIKNKNKIPKVR